LPPGGGRGVQGALATYCPKLGPKKFVFSPWGAPMIDDKVDKL